MTKITAQDVMDDARASEGLALVAAFTRDVVTFLLSAPLPGGAIAMVVHGVVVNVLGNLPENTKKEILPKTIANMLNDLVRAGVELPFPIPPRPEGESITLEPKSGLFHPTRTN